MTTNESKKMKSYEETLDFIKSVSEKVPTIDSRSRNREVFDAAIKAIHEIAKEGKEEDRGAIAVALEYMIIQFFNTVNARTPAPLGEILGEK